MAAVRSWARPPMVLGVTALVTWVPVTGARSATTLAPMARMLVILEGR